MIVSKGGENAFDPPGLHDQGWQCCAVQEAHPNPRKAHGPTKSDLRQIDGWTRAHGFGAARIDPGFDPAMKAAFEALGLADMLR